MSTAANREPRFSIPPHTHTHRAFLPKLRNSQRICRRQTSSMPNCNREGRKGGCLPPGHDKRLPVAAPLWDHSPRRLLGSEAPQHPSPRPWAACTEGQRRRGAERRDLTLLKCHTLMGMENVNFLCIPGTIPWGGDL